MAEKNNRRENTFKTKGITDIEPFEEQVIDPEENKKEEKPKKKSDKSPKNKEPKPQKNKVKQESDGRLSKIIGILFLCLAVFLGIALISYLVSFFSGHHQEYGYQIFSQKVNIENRTGRAGVFLAQTLIKESFGIGAFFFVYLLTLIGLRLNDSAKIKMWSLWKWALLCLVWLPLFFAFIATAAPKCAIFGGAVGLWLNTLLTKYVGKTGVIIILAFLFLVFLRLTISSNCAKNVKTNAVTRLLSLPNNKSRKSWKEKKTTCPMMGKRKALCLPSLHSQKTLRLRLLLQKTIQNSKPKKKTFSFRLTMTNQTESKARK